MTVKQSRGEFLKEIHYSTAPAILAQEMHIIGDTPDERAACWHNVLLLFDPVESDKK